MPDFLGMIPQSQEPTVQAPKANVIHNGSEIKITYITERISQSEINVTYFLSNSTSHKLNNIKLTILAKSNINASVLSTSSTYLGANQTNGIKKEIKLVNSDLNQKMMIKLKLVYLGGSGAEVTESVTQSDF